MQYDFEKMTVNLVKLFHSAQCNEEILFVKLFNYNNEKNVWQLKVKSYALVHKIK